MMQQNNHFRQVELWVEQKLKGLSPGEVIDAFNNGFQRVWSKAELTLGKVTMRAVADRIVHVGREEYPWLSLIRQNDDGIDLTEFAQTNTQIPDNELRLGLSYLLGEFLRVLGSLTAEIISSKLHKTLMEDPGADDSASGVACKNKDSNRSVSKGGKR